MRWLVFCFLFTLYILVLTPPLLLGVGDGLIIVKNLVFNFYLNIFFLRIGFVFFGGFGLWYGRILVLPGFVLL
ncbi:hypothetical protein BDV34DRAFT_154131 [Aspergillus parasiticus]|uniref:Uncharacterized protein n=1 Tax=Aspergillus parasiticus TaxID=5067 RepID=A0A5N6DZ86_ASPPA|nr:hypothetical protein BDV34DRAFT_154131 [Aspergillus parasiticus]